MRKRLLSSKIRLWASSFGHRLICDPRNYPSLAKPISLMALDYAMARERVPQLAIPDAAVQMVEGSPAVFVPVPGEEGTFARRAVTVGIASDTDVEIREGLTAGDEVVGAGSFYLKTALLRERIGGGE